MFFVSKSSQILSVARVAKIHNYTSVLRPRNKALKMPWIKGLPEGKSPARDECGSAEPITLDTFFKAFKESTEKQDKRFKDQHLKMDQRFDELTEIMEGS